MIDKDQLFKIGLGFKSSTDPSKRWDDLNRKHGFPFESGERWRDYVRKRIKRENIEEENLVGEKTGQEEVVPKIQDKGDYYIITSGKRSITITKTKVKELKTLYCDSDPLTINEICRKLDLPRRDFFLVKTAFGITHDDVPYIDDDIVEEKIDELVKETLEKRKEKYFIKLQQLEIEDLKREVAQYRKKDYFYNKVIDQMSIPIRPLTFNIRKNILSDIECQLNMADWHTGLKVENYWNKYSLDIQKQRLQELTEKVIQYIHRHKTKKLHIMNLGDILHGVIHVSTRIVAEVDVIQQFRIAWQLISDILETLAKEVEQVYFYSTYGNHSRITEKKEDALDRENLELLFPDILKANLQNISNIAFMPNEYDDQILVAKPCGYTVLGVHGDRDKPEKVAGNLTMMLEMKPYKIFTAHSHHKEQIETHKVDVVMSRSLCGVDDFAKDIRATSRAGQSFYIYNQEGLECSYDINFN